MIPIDVLSLFALAAVLLALAPGPDNIFVLTQSALYGPRSGIVVTLGLCSGVFVHTMAVAFGVAALFQTSATAFTLLKTFGVAYLLYLAWGAFRAGAVGLDSGARALPSLRRLYARGIIMNLSNPKVAIFFLAFLPQFTDPARGPLAPQLMVLGAVFVLSAIVVFGAIAFGAGWLGGWLRRSPRAQLVLNRLAGTVFVALAARLAFSQR